MSRIDIDRLRLAAGKKIKERQYWLEQLAGELPKSTFPVFAEANEAVSAAGKSGERERMDFTCDGILFAQLEKLSTGSDIRLFIILAALVMLLLNKYTGNADILLGAPALRTGKAGEKEENPDEAQSLINTVVTLRSWLESSMTFKDLLFQVRKVVREADENRNYPFEILWEQIGLTSPPFDAAVLLASVHDKRYLDSISPRVIFSFNRVGNTIGCCVDYAAAFYHRSNIERITRHFMHISHQALANVEKQIAAVDIVLPEEKEQILCDFNDTKRDYPRQQTIHGLFSEMAAKTPDRIALVDADGRMLSYHQLDIQSGLLAGELRAEGIETGAIIAISLERSSEMIAVIFGILKAGAAYLPIDPQYPEERKRYIINDSAARIFITQPPAGMRRMHPLSRFAAAGWRPLPLEEKGDRQPPAGAPSHRSRCSLKDLAYIIYTSGSTGRPKGVMVGHRAVVNLLFAMQEAFPLLAADVYLFKTAFIFDVSVAELFGWFFNGGRLALLQKDAAADPLKILDAIEKYKVTHINFVPSMFHVFVGFLRPTDTARIVSLKYIFLAGEELHANSLDIFNRLFTDNVSGTGAAAERSTGIALANIYGPTEATVYASMYPLSCWHGSVPIPIGQPLKEVQLYILNKDNHLQPVGIPGELFIGGAGLAQGYLNNPELTAERFAVGDRSLLGASRHSTLYRTGDLCRWLPDGNIEFLGRIDQQVKIRGFRIELGEIENRLLQCEAVKEAVVTVQRNNTGENYLCVYVVPSPTWGMKETPGTEGAMESSQQGLFDNLRASLSAALPDYMVPTYFLKLDKIPLNPSGKIDRKALPLPDAGKNRKSYTAPRDLVEEKLVQIWEEVFHLEEGTIGIDADFLGYGGHSLRASMMSAKIKKELAVDISISDLIENPSIRDLAEKTRHMSMSTAAPVEPVEEKEYYPLSPAQKRLYIIDQLVEKNTGYNMPFTVPIRGNVDKNRLETVFKTLIKRHDSLRTSFIQVDGQPVQRIHRPEDIDFTIEYVDADSRNLIYPFDLSRAPLLRVYLLQHDNRAQELFIDMHHIISDGTSQDILQREFSALYTRPGETLPTPRLQYRDYSRWVTGSSQQETVKIQENYWLQEFCQGDELPILNVPVDFPRPAVQGFEGNWVEFAFSESETGALMTALGQHGLTLYMGLLAAFNILFWRLCRQEDIVFGTPVAARRHSDLQEVVGMLVNTLPMRNYPTSGKTVNFFFQEVKQRTLEAFENQEYPFEMLVDQLAIVRDTSRNPLFDVMLNLLNQWSTGTNSGRVGAGALTSTSGEEGDRVELDLAAGQELLQIPAHPPYRHIERTSRFDLTFSAVMAGERLVFFLEYSTKLFTPATIERYIGYLKNLVMNLPGDGERRLGDIDYISKQEKEEILQMCWGEGNDFLPQGERDGRTVHRLFLEQAARTPNSISLSGSSIKEVKVHRGDGNMQLTYGELAKRAHHVAYLLQLQGMTTGAVAGVMVHRSVEMIAAILGILLAGGCYLPIDPAYPRQRIGDMLADSQAPFLITQESLLAGFSGGDLQSNPIPVPSQGQQEAIAYPGQSRQPGPSVIPGQPVHQVITVDGSGFDGNGREVTGLATQPRATVDDGKSAAGDMLYVIYTSGSTGRPKGVILEHGNLVNLILYQYRYTNIDFSRVLQFTTISFDVSAQEIFSTLLAGGRLTLLSKETITDIPRLFGIIGKECIKTVFLPASFLKFVMNREENVRLIPATLAHIVTAGEQVVINRSFREYLHSSGVYLHNHYGPSETHVATALTLDPQDDIPEIPAIGRPVANTAVYILDKDERVVPHGVTGELCIGGLQVGRGYLNRPELTAERFVIGHSSLVIGKRRGTFSEAYSNGYETCLPRSGLFPAGSCLSRPPATLYRTGDLARYLADGNLEFLGRIDHQVKIRGFRVELGEIETCLLDHESVKDCVVIPRQEESGSSYLCAYLVMKREVDTADLRQYLEKVLPNYMVPAYFVFLDQIPLTPNRKVDRRALPEPELTTGKNDIAPRTLTEIKLAQTWARVLNTRPEVLSVDSNFFSTGGHSLSATIMAAAIHKEFNVKLPLAAIFKSPTIAGLAQVIEGLAQEQFTAVEPVEKREYYRLSSAQERLFIIHEMLRENVVYNMPAAFDLDGDSSTTRLEEIFRQLIARHESLRTSFHMVAGQPVQKIHPAGEINLNIEYSSQLPHPCYFDLATAPLLRVVLQQKDNGTFSLFVDMHHIISDGVSIDVLIHDFEKLRQGQELPPLSLQYKDYAIWQRQLLQSGRVKEQMEFWLAELAGDIPVLDIPTDFPRPAVQSFSGSIFSYSLAQASTRQLKELVSRTGTTMFMVLAALFNVLLSRLSGSEEVIIGTPVAGRHHADLRHIIGMFVNTLVLRNYPTGDKSFSQFLAEVKERALLAFENQDCAFEDLVELLKINREAGRNPLFDVMFTLRQSIDAVGTGMNSLRPGSGIETGPVTGMAKFDITLAAVDLGDHLVFHFEYSTALFQQATIARFMDYYERLITILSTEPHLKIGTAAILSEAEKNRILYEWNNTATGYPRDKTIHGLFAEQVGKTPDYIALVEPSGSQLSYRQLDYQAQYQAIALKEKGVAADTIVALICERSIEMIAAIFAILKAGGAYLPIDRVYPPERVEYMLKDSRTQVVLSDQDIQWSARHPGYTGQVNEQDSTISGQLKSADLAYIIYTSGTTGKPKGSMITHDNVVRLMFNDAFQFDFGSSDVWTMFHTYCFDFSVWEMYGALLYGGRLIIVPRPFTRDPLNYLQLLKSGHVTVLNQTPSVFYHLIDEELKSPGRALRLKYVIFGGEALKPGKLKAWREKYPGTRLINMYGITETTVHVTYKEITSFEIENNISNIGCPIPTLQTYVMNREALVPTGTAGELWVGGAGVGRGYLNRPELTSEKFIKREFGMNTKQAATTSPNFLYKSGDLVRQLGSGELEYLGRIDHQVKIRGFRVELGEIENRLLTHEAIKEAIVLDRAGETGDNHLYAYIVMTTQGRDGTSESKSVMRAGLLGELREYLAKTLPDYMVPTFFVPLEQIPVTANGKVDRKALPMPRAGMVTTGQDYVAPKSRTEMLVAETWKEVLKLERVGIDDNFFEVGGNSLNIVQVFHKLNEVFPVNLQMMIMFRCPTIRELAQVFDQPGQGSEEIPDRKQRAETLARGKRDRAQRLEKRKQTPLRRLEKPQV